MKLASNLSEKSEHPAQETKIADRNIKRYLKYVGIALVVMLLLALVVLAALIYWNTKINKKIYNHVSDIKAGMDDIEVDTDIVVENPTPGPKDVTTAKKPLPDHVEANITYRIAESGDELNENIMVSGNEEIITTSGSRIVFDYSTGLMVTRLGDSENDVCFVSKFNVTESIDSVKEFLINEKTNETVANVSDEKFEITTELSNDTMLSPGAADMCDGSKLLWVNKTTEVNNDGTKLAKRSCRWIKSRYCRSERYSEKRCTKTCKKGWWRRRTRCSYSCKYHTAYRTVCYTQEYYCCGC